jgi:hypothetical protein
MRFFLKSPKNKMSKTRPQNRGRTAEFLRDLGGFMGRFFEAIMIFFKIHLSLNQVFP